MPECPAKDPRERHFWRNVVWMEATETLWGFGLPMVASGTILAVFLKRLGATEVIIGLLPALQQVAFGIVQLPATRWTRFLPSKAPVCGSIYGLSCLFLVIAGVLALNLSQSSPRLMVAVLLTLSGLNFLVMGIAQPIWADALTRLFPDNRRGFATGTNWVFYGAFGILGAFLAKHILATQPYPRNFAELLILGGLFAGAGMQFMWLCKEHKRPFENEVALSESYATMLLRRWRTERRLRRFVAARWAFDAGNAVGIFLAVNALKRFGLTGAHADAAAGTSTIVLSVAFMLGGLVFGAIGDRRGYRRVIGWGMAVCCMSSIWALCAPSLLLYYAVFLLQGISVAGVAMGSMNFAIEITPPGFTNSATIAIINTLLVPVWASAPIIAGALAERYSIPHALLAGLLLQGLGWIALIALVDDPRRPGQRIIRWSHPRWRTLPRFMW